MIELKAIIPRLVADLACCLYSVRLFGEMQRWIKVIEIATYHPCAMGRVQMLAVTLRSANKSPKRSNKKSVEIYSHSGVFQISGSCESPLKIVYFLKIWINIQECGGTGRRFVFLVCWSK